MDSFEQNNAKFFRQGITLKNLSFGFFPAHLCARSSLGLSVCIANLSIASHSRRAKGVSVSFSYDRFPEACKVTAERMLLHFGCRYSISSLDIDHIFGSLV